MKASRWILHAGMAWTVLFLVSPEIPVWSQGNMYEGGRILRDDERGEALQLGQDDESEEGSEATGKPWIPVLSPVMICLDCFITRTLKIKDFYEQQAADEYFAHSESCADLILCPDPNVRSALKYSLLAPVYAMCPRLLWRNRAACGICNPYGVPAPMPGVAVNGAQGPQVLPPMPAAPPPTGELPPPPEYAPPGGGPGMSQSTQPASAPKPPRVASSSPWAQMSDAEILAHFGLNPAVAQDAPVPWDPREQKVADADWQYADEAPVTSASMLIAQREAAEAPVTAQPSAIQPSDAAVLGLPPGAKIVSVSSKPLAETEVKSGTEGKTSEVSVEAPKSEFSVTDHEYDRMREIEKDLLTLPARSE